MNNWTTAIPVLVVGYHNFWAFNRCRSSVLDQSVYVRLHVHDNGGTMPWSQPCENIGYTRGMNKLLWDLNDKSQCRYAVLLNQDIILSPDAIEKAVQFMDAHPRCAIAGFKQLDASDPDRIIHGGTGSPFPAGEHLTGRVSNGDCSESRRFLWVNGAATIVRLEALKDIGLMDEQFFNIGSDSDWCLTAWMKKWEVWYCAEAVCLHETHGCSREPDPEQLKLAAQDMGRWGEKWSALLSANIFHDANELHQQQTAKQ